MTSGWGMVVAMGLGFSELGASPIVDQQHWDRAQQTHNFVVGHMLVRDGATFAYRARVGAGEALEKQTFGWHDTSQLWADSTMLPYDARYADYVSRDYAQLDLLWDKTTGCHGGTGIGGYYAWKRLDQSGPGYDRIKYADDNALAGLAYLHAYDSTHDAAYLGSARAIASYFTQRCGHPSTIPWDYAAGGGFWWNSKQEAGVGGEGGHATQANALAFALFVGLTEATGERTYREWADRILGWLDARRFNRTVGLYDWNEHHSHEFFAYDNAILFEAFLRLARIDKDPRWLKRAQQVAGRLDRLLWDKTHRVYWIHTTDDGSYTTGHLVSPTFGAWVSVALLALYRADGNRAWLDRARANVDTIDRLLRDPKTGGYYGSCAPDGQARVTWFQTVDQAWMQRVHAELAITR